MVDLKHTADEQAMREINWLEDAAKYFEQNEKYTETRWNAEQYQKRAKAIRAAMRRVAAPKPAQQTDRNAVLEEALQEIDAVKSRWSHLTIVDQIISAIRALKSTPPQQPEDK